MDWHALAALLLRYTLLGAVLTVGVAYFAFSSGPTLLLLAGAGVLLVVLGAGEAGATPAAGVEAAEDAEMSTEGMQLVPGSGANYSLRVKLLFYGIGLVIWPLVGLTVLLR